MLYVYIYIYTTYTCIYIYTHNITIISYDTTMLYCMLPEGLGEARRGVGRREGAGDVQAARRAISLSANVSVFVVMFVLAEQYRLHH